MVADPPCTDLAVSGARWFRDKAVPQAEALAFVRALVDAPYRRSPWNPVSIISSHIASRTRSSSRGSSDTAR